MRRLIAVLIFALSFAATDQALGVTLYSSSLCIPKPTPNDPASQNSWGTLLNTGADIIDGATSAVSSISVAGAANVVLTFNCGSLDQTDAAVFKFTGVLTGNIYVLWPNSRGRVFTVINATTGSFTLGLGANNGASAPAGSTTPVPQGYTGEYYSDGTNVLPRVSSGALNMAASSVAGNITNGVGPGADVVIPTCTGGLTWTIGVGYGCNNTFGGLSLSQAQAAANSF